MLSCYFIVKDAEKTLQRALKSVKSVADEIIIIDDGSKDSSPSIAKKYGAKVVSFINPSEGEKRKFALEQCKYDWVLCMDADEEISPELATDIKKVLEKPEKDGYIIPFLNHFLGHPLRYGGENYAILRLFRKSKADLENTPIHAFHHLPEAQSGRLEGYILHYSYQSLWQVYSKFTNYAFREAHKRIAKGEKSSLKKITMYPVHMFWARYIEDKGYKDGLIRIPLDLGFAYMEWLMYVLMIFIKK
jgi:glycosyltransferase involved in cell wall biosynthesis